MYALLYPRRRSEVLAGVFLDCAPNRAKSAAAFALSRRSQVCFLVGQSLDCTLQVGRFVPL